MGKITYINNDGGGFANEVDVLDGETIEAFLVRQGLSNFGNYHIRLRSPGGDAREVTASTQLVAGQTVSAVARAGTIAASEPMQSGGTVSATPKRVAGALLEQEASIRNILG